jgi:hypothetical protein
MKKIVAVTIIAICLNLIVGPVGLVMAQDTGQDTVDSKCTLEMRPFINEKSKEFRTYLSSHLQNKSTNSSLLDLALKRFEVYKKDLFKKLETYYPQAGFSQYTEALDSLSCYKQMNQEIGLMEQLMKNYFQQTSNVKTATALMTKLQTINKKLDELARSIIQMLGKWESLKNRVPCFVKQCL